MLRTKTILSLFIVLTLLLGLGIPTYAATGTVVLDFDELTGANSLPSDYAGLLWESGWEYYDWEQFPYNPSSGLTRIYNYSADPWIDFSPLGQAVNFVGASFSGLTDVSVYFEGYRNDVLVATSDSLTLSSTPTFLAAGFGKSVDKVIVRASRLGFFVLDDLTYSDSEPKSFSGRRELITLQTNPADGSGVRTQNLNYYLNDPIIWQTDVKNITVWLESEIFDLAKARQKAKLPSGLKLLKDYNIRLMMKIEYIDGTVKTKEIDNAHIARNIPVLIPVDEFAGLSDLGIVYIDTKGNTAVLPVTPVTLDGKKYLQFENNHFSEYGVVSGTASPTSAEKKTYTIQPGDTLASIAAKFGVTVQSLAAANNIANVDWIIAGQELIIA